MRFISSAALVSLLLLAACSTTPSVSGANQTDLTTKRGGVISNEEAGASNTERTMRMAERALAEGKPEVAAVFYRTAALADPSDPRPRVASAVLFEKGGEYAAAAGMYEELARNKKHDGAWLDAGRNYLKANNTESALQAYRAALEETPKDPRALNGWAVAYDLRQEHMAAGKLYEQAFDSADEKMRQSILVNWGLSLMLAGEAGQAVQKLEPAVRENDTPALRQTLALAYGLVGRTEEAQQLGLANPPTYDQLRTTVKEYGMAGPTSGAPAASPVADVVTVPPKNR